MTHNIVFGILYLFNIQNLLYIFYPGKTAKEDNLYGLSNYGWLLVPCWWLLVVRSGSFKQQRICNKQQETF